LPGLNISWSANYLGTDVEQKMTKELLEEYFRVQQNFVDRQALSLLTSAG
jgi:hypothetical protein